MYIMFVTLFIGGSGFHFQVYTAHAKVVNPRGKGDEIQLRAGGAWSKGMWIVAKCQIPQTLYTLEDLVVVVIMLHGGMLADMESRKQYGMGKLIQKNRRVFPFLKVLHGAAWQVMGFFEHGHGHTSICWEHADIGRHMNMGIQLHECMGLGSSGLMIHVQDCNKSGFHESKLVGLY